jgi:hypothetical protein
MSAVRRHPIITFFVLAYAISWGFLPIEAVRFLPTGPLFAALIVISLTQGLSGLRELGLRMIRWRVRWYWYALALGLPLAVHLLSVGLNVATGAGVPSLTFSSLTTFLMVFAIRMVNPADGPVGENPGWQGFAARSRLASAHLLPGRGWLAAVRRRGRLRDDDGGDDLVQLALQPHWWQRAPGHRGAQPRRKHPVRVRLDLHVPVVRGGDRVGRLRLEGLARSCASARDLATGV